MTRLTADRLRTVREGLAAGEAADRFRAAIGGIAVEALVHVDVRGTTARVPAAAVRTFIELLEDISEGRAVTVAPADVLIGTEEAARLLGVSRTWVAQLIDDAKLPAVRRGSKRRIALGDLVARRRADTKRLRSALDRIDSAAHEDDARSIAPASSGILVGASMRYTHVGTFDGEYVRHLREGEAEPPNTRADNYEPALAA